MEFSVLQAVFKDFARVACFTHPWCIEIGKERVSTAMF
jgi:hypothetical protein